MPVAADFIDSVQGAAFAGDDVIGGFAPDERLWLGVVEQEIIVDGRVQIIEAGIAFPANALRGGAAGPAGALCPVDGHVREHFLINSKNRTRYVSLRH